jgi:hypothetical protein
MTTQDYNNNPVNPYAGIWEDLMDLPYQTNLASMFPKIGQGSSQGRYWANRLGQVQNEYIGAVGQQMGQTGSGPTLQFEDFLKNYPFAGRYAALAPGAKGQLSQRFNPRTRWLTY